MCTRIQLVDTLVGRNDTKWYYYKSENILVEVEKARLVESMAQTSNKAVTLFSSSCYLSSYLLYSSILSPHAKLEDSLLRIAPSAKKQQRGRLHATCRWSWLLAGESIIESRHSYTHGYTRTQLQNT